MADPVGKKRRGADVPDFSVLEEHGATIDVDTPLDWEIDDPWAVRPKGAADDDPAPSADESSADPEAG